MKKVPKSAWLFKSSGHLPLNDADSILAAEPIVLIAPRWVRSTSVSIKGQMQTWLVFDANLGHQICVLILSIFYILLLINLKLKRFIIKVIIKEEKRLMNSPNGCLISKEKYPEQEVDKNIVKWIPAMFVLVFC